MDTADSIILKSTELLTLQQHKSTSAEIGDLRGLHVRVCYLVTGGLEKQTHLKHHTWAFH